MFTARATGPLQYRRGDPRGQVLVLFALVLVVLLLVSALAIDYGGFLVTKRNYQNASDAASLSGAQQLTRPLTAACPSGPSKNFCAREAAWASVAAALGFTGVDPVVRAGAASNLAYQENGYTVWVASPPGDANVPCNGSNPLCIASGHVYPGHVSGPGVVFVRIDHEAATYMSRIAGIGRTVSAWSTAGRFPANFAVIGLCDPFDVSSRCLANDANIKLDGSNTNLIVETGDLGSNRWTKSGGNNSGVALGPDSNAYMSMYDTCWGYSSNQCQLWTYSGGAIDTSSLRNAIPLGAPVTDPAYPAPTINGTTAPNQCLGSGTVQLASVQTFEQPADPGSDFQLAAVVRPQPLVTVTNAVPTNNDLQGFVKAFTGGAALNGMNVSATNGTNTYTGATSGGGPNAGRYSGGNFSNIQSGTYDITATDPLGVYHQTTVVAAAVISAVSSNTTVTATQINMQRNPIIAGTVTSGGSPVGSATITITGPGGPFTTTTAANGTYSQIITTFGTFGAYDVTASKAGYVSNTVNSGLLSLDTTTTVNISLTPAPGSLTGTITDQTTGLAVPNVTVTLSTGEVAVTNASGVYDIPSTGSGSKTVTLSNIPGYSYSTPTSPATVNVSGATTRNFTLWPKGCRDNGGDRGDYDCGFSTGDCGTVTNLNAAGVSCSKFDQSNAIRPGTYNDITIDGCAWFDPTGGQTGLAAGQSAGIYHIKGTLSMSGDSYIFGDGVTLIFDQGAGIDVGNGGGFVLNYGTLHTTPGDASSACAYTTAKKYGDGYSACFRTRSDGQDYAYAAWTSKGVNPWTGSGTSVTYNDGLVAKGSELGITFFLWCPSGTPQCGLGNDSRFKLSTANMGYLFNGVLYGPGDDIEMGGGKNGQTAAGQLVGWTIEYHGGTAIQQNWYGDPVDGPPFLIEPVLGE